MPEVQGRNSTGQLRPSAQADDRLPGVRREVLDSQESGTRVGQECFWCWEIVPPGLRFCPRCAACVCCE